MNEELNNPEFSHAADRFLQVFKNYLAKYGNKSPTKKELLDLAKKVLEKRA